MGAHDDAVVARRHFSVHVVSPSVVVAVAYAAGLVAEGWRRARPVVDPAQDPALPHAPSRGLLLVADEHGRLPDLPAARFDVAESVVVVAGRDACRSVLRALELRAALVDVDQSLQAQLRAVGAALTRRQSPDREAVTTMVRTWVSDADLVAALTARETDVLDLLMLGHSATSAAERLVLTVATVRTHIQSILRKLQVPSQVAAVALACRARCVPGGRRCRSHQF